MHVLETCDLWKRWATHGHTANGLHSIANHRGVRKGRLLCVLHFSAGWSMQIYCVHRGNLLHCRTYPTTPPPLLKHWTQSQIALIFEFWNEGGVEVAVPFNSNIYTFSSRHTCAGIFKQSMGTRNRVGIGLSYQPTRLHRVAELIPWNRFLASLKV